MRPAAPRPALALATASERETIFRLRHEVYARELGQHSVNAAEALSDALDEGDGGVPYLVARQEGEILGFVSVTPPGAPRYSIDKYLDRSALPFALDAGLFEIRLLTVVAARRRSSMAIALMYAALRWVEAHGGTAVVALGRREIAELYAKAGLRSTGIEITAGRVSYLLMHAPLAEIRRRAEGVHGLVDRVLRAFDWQLPVGPRPAAPCAHGGAFFDAIGRSFDALERRHEVINADVLDAWFPPSPRAVAAVAEHLDWALRTSPPTDCEGLLDTIAEVRGLRRDGILPGGGSSDLIYLALRRWLRAGDRVLVLDPSYGEYAHLLENVIGCHVERFELARDEGWRVDPGRLAATLQRGYDVVVLVNPNSPTGVHLAREALAGLLRGAPAATRFWIDETYVDYAGPGHSLEQLAIASSNVVVCKSMSKAYALSGVRCAYLCASRSIVEELRLVTPPWTVGLVGQIAAVEALRDTGYYETRWRETAALRDELGCRLAGLLGAEVVAGVANFVLLHLPAAGPRPVELARRCRERGLFLRTFAEMGRLAPDSLRIAVKDAATQLRMLSILREALEVSS